MTLFSNHSIGRFCASLLTTVVIAAGIDGAAHQRQRGGLHRIVARGHQRGGGEHRNGGLADRDHMGVGPQKLDELDDIVDEIVEIERRLGATGTIRASIQSVT